MIDSHAHLTDERFDADRAAVIRRARDAGVEAIVCPGTDVASSRRALDLAHEFEPVLGAEHFRVTVTETTTGLDISLDGLRGGLGDQERRAVTNAVLRLKNIARVSANGGTPPFRRTAPSPAL